MKIFINIIISFFLLINNNFVKGQELRDIKICQYKSDGSVSQKCMKVKILPFFYNDTIADEILIEACNKYKIPKLGKPYYILYQSDTNKIATVVSNNVISKFWENGNFKSFSAYRYFKQQGKYYEYYQSGVKKIDGIYNKGKKIGKWKYFNEEGKKNKIEKYNLKGEL